MRRPALALLALLAIAACDCREKSDMERLREQVDTTKVHLWVATKVAVAKVDSDDPRVVEARRNLMALLEAYQAARAPDGASEENDERLGEDDDEEPAAQPTETTLELSEAVDLAVALWDLRATGARIVREDSEDELASVLPILLRSRGVSGPLVDRIDGNTEHALLMVGLFALKLHPESPTPVPVEILLYEGMHVDAGALAIPGLHDPVLAVRSYLYAQSDYCDLAKADAAALDEGETQRLSELLVALGGDELGGEDARRAAGAIRGVAHGATALCFMNREEDEEAAEELQAFVDSAEQGGAAPEDLAVIRAYLAYREEDLEETRRQLVLAKDSQYLDEAERAEIDGLVAQLDREESGALDATFDQAYLGAALVTVTWHELERAGVFEALEDAPIFHGVRDFVRGATAGVRGASETVSQTVEETESATAGALEGGRGLLEGLLGD